MSTNPIATTFDSVTGYLSWDHDRLESILGVVRCAVDFGHWDEARAAYPGFEVGLDRHIRLEEEILFPLFEARSGIVDGPTAVMRQEHRAIRRAMDLMGQGVEEGDAALFEEGFGFLGTVMPPHNSKEEHVLYPTIDRLLSQVERARVAERLQAR